MDEFFPEEIPAIRESVIRFMETRVNPVMDGYEERGEAPRDLVIEAGDAGFFGAVFPESVGGTDLGYLAAVVIQEEVARNDIRFAACLNQQSSTCPNFIYYGGTPQQVMKYVPNLLAGRTIGMMSLSEPGGGSDPLGAMKTVARRDGDVYRINGSKMWASLANETDVGVLVCKTDPDAGAKGVSAFIVEPKKYPGWTAQPVPMLGLSKAFRTNALFLDDFVVPAENLIGKEGDGFKIAMRALQPGRVTVAAKALGIARAAFDEAVKYANERVIKGSPIGKFQMIQSDIADMAAQIEASRTLVYHAAQCLDANLPSNRIASIAKYHASLTAKSVADKAQQIFGGYGLSTEYKISYLKAYSDMFYTGEGTANVQKIVIAEDALGYKLADRHHGTSDLRNPRMSDVARELQGAE
ncbi:acyl-CoA dehydrogenase family protein [Celeribacter indicus]|uniref:Acyl-CoA dehydrogenase yngJ n=1 Tax=Celeribacter indicus TaxID=1208324 RepID=A0A0B5E0L1_9RHOB|nr:acyl-CoA dehydrogenase family protein [Celeribacter indicus]AJE49178.1 acyl-CoA dehydrogenase yngJ [Celeribacter indicus]SDX18210.1 isovaleryl-CoA dehydrogenase [Celeribacter indicus]